MRKIVLVAALVGGLGVAGCGPHGAVSNVGATPRTAPPVVSLCAPGSGPNPSGAYQPGQVTSADKAASDLMRTAASFDASKPLPTTGCPTPKNVPAPVGPPACAVTPRGAPGSC